MSSQNSTDEVLELLETLSRQELQEKIDGFIPTLISSLSVEDENCKAIKVVHVLLHSCLPLVNIHNAESKILKYALPVLKQLFLESINGIRFKFELEECSDQDTIVDHVEGLLKVCLILLDSVESGLQYVITSGKVNVNEIPSLPKNVIDILLEAFKHCKESEKIYGEFFQHLCEDLSILFKKSHAIQGQLIAALTNNISFNCSYEEDLIILTEVLDTLEEIGEVVTGLDIKTMANQWKLYAKLVQENAENLKQRLDISRPVKFLSKDITNGLKNVLESDLNDLKNVTKTLKLLNFTLKLIMLFCELYIGYLGECHDELINLMLYLLSYSQPHLQLKMIPNKVIDDIENYLVIGVEPLVSRLILEEELSRAYFQFGSILEEKENLKLGFLLLSNILLKNLSHYDEDVRKHWLQNDPNSNIIYVIFRSLKQYHVELTLSLQIKGSCKGPDSEGKDATHGLYEAVLIHLSAFMTTIPARNIPMLEKVLLECILQENDNLWRALMAVDVWCMIARLGSAEFCFQQVCQLSKLYKKMSNDKSCPEASYVRMLLGRLFPLLSNKDMIRMAELFPPVSNSRLWLVFGLSKLPVQLRVKLQEELLTNASQEIDGFFSSTPTVTQYANMMDALIGASAALGSLSNEQRKESDTIKTFVSKITDLWVSVPIPTTSQDKSLKWLDNFLSDISIATANAAQLLTNSQILQILQILQNRMLQNLYSIKLASVKIIRGLAKKLFASDLYQDQVCQEVSSLFSSLLKDNNPLIQQLSLEAFTYFSHVTQHEKIVALSVGGCEEVKKAVSNYLMKIPFMNTSGKQISFEEYLKKQSQSVVIHHCRFLGKSHSNILDIKPLESDDLFSSESEKIKKSEENDVESQKRKIDDDLFVVVKRMKEDVNYITEAYARKSLPHDVQEEVQEMVSKLTSIR